VAATKGRSGSAMTVRRRHGTGMGKSGAPAERRRREGRTDNGARREREGEGRAQEKQSDEESVSHRFHRCGSRVIHSLAFCCAAVSFPPPLSRPSRLRFPYEFTRRLRRTATATSSQLITPSPYILYCRISSPSHTAFITLSPHPHTSFIATHRVSHPTSTDQQYGTQHTHHARHATGECSWRLMLFVCLCAVGV